MRTSLNASLMTATQWWRSWGWCAGGIAGASRRHLGSAVGALVLVVVCCCAEPPRHPMLFVGYKGKNEPSGRGMMMMMRSYYSSPLGGMSSLPE